MFLINWIKNTKNNYLVFGSKDDKNKAKHCDHVVVNEKNLNILKKNLLDILNEYE